MRFREIREKKKISAKDDPCWSGYHMVGTKMKGGREVPNCVPGKKGVSELANRARRKMEVLDEISDDLQEDYDKSHGSPYDRGSADKYYGRRPEPHKGGVGGGSGPRSTDLTREEIAAYMAGYREETDRKQWESVEEAGAVDTIQKPAVKKPNSYISMLIYKLRNDKPMNQREREDLRDYLKKIGVKTKESVTEAMKLSDIPTAMRRRLTMKDIEDEQPKGAYRYRVHHGKPEHERPRDFMNKAAADEYARAVKGRVEDLGEAEVDERKLTAHELERREEIVKGMKKSKADFEKRYGDRAKSVMYATATKIAKNEDINESRRLAADEGHYYCEAERQVKEIPEGYIKVAGGYIMKKI